MNGLIVEVAEEKICPIMSKPDDMVKCIVGSCMMWRWQETPWVEGTMGYCGIGGKP